MAKDLLEMLVTTMKIIHVVGRTVEVAAGVVGFAIAVSYTHLTLPTKA